MSLKNKLGALGAVLSVAVAMSLSSCNSDKSEVPTYDPLNAVNVTSFTIKNDSKVLTGLDKVFFSIDLQKGVIFNADSLPKGTEITDLIPVISFPSSVAAATIVMEGGKKREGEIDYIKNPSDSVDFTGNVTLRLTSTQGNFATYKLKVNVHEMEPDSLCWDSTAESKLPSQFGTPLKQRTVMFGDKVMTLIQESYGTFTLATTDSPSSADWHKETLRLGFEPQIRSFTATDNALYMLDSNGLLYKSSDGLNWQSTSQKWSVIVGGYGTTVLGLREQNGQIHHTGYPAGQVSEAVIDSRFPVKEFTNLHCLTSKWAAEPTAIVAGGVDALGEISSRVWAYDGSNWVLLSDGVLPALRGATLIPYFAYRYPGTTSWDFKEYSVLMLAGGIGSNGDYNRSLYISFDSGVNWSKGSELMQMPSEIPGMWNIDNAVAFTPKSASLEIKGWNSVADKALPVWYKVNHTVDGQRVEWDCPYIYLFGGEQADGTLYNSIWRGVINRLTFAPLI